MFASFVGILLITGGGTVVAVDTGLDVVMDAVVLVTGLKNKLEELGGEGEAGEGEGEEAGVWGCVEIDENTNGAFGIEAGAVIPKT